MNHKPPSRPGRSTAPSLLIAPGSQPWARRLGPLAWTTLQHLALASQPTDRGWAAPVGVRDIAGGIGVTKDTAARAISILARAGFVARDRIESPGGRRRSGYLLRLPEPLSLIDVGDATATPQVPPAGNRGRGEQGHPPNPGRHKGGLRAVGPDNEVTPPEGCSQPDLFVAGAADTASTTAKERA